MEAKGITAKTVTRVMDFSCMGVQMNNCQIDSANYINDQAPLIFDSYECRSTPMLLKDKHSQIAFIRVECTGVLKK